MSAPNQLARVYPHVAQRRPLGVGMISLPPIGTDRERWERLERFAALHGLQLPAVPELVVAPVVAEEPWASARCDLCGQPGAGSLCRLEQVQPTIIVHEACRMLEVLGEWTHE